MISVKTISQGSLTTSIVHPREDIQISLLNVGTHGSSLNEAKYELTRESLVFNILP